MRRALGPLILVAAGLVVSALLVEGLVWVAYGEQVRFPRRVVGAPFGLRINEPGARYGHHSADVSVEFRINARGLRADRDYPYAKPPGVSRIVSLGDSFTVGFEVEVEETFSSVLERELRRRGYEVEVLNAGVSGYGTAEATLYLERELLRYEPDVVLLSFFGNDFVDNLRSNLFALEDGVLREADPSYVPAGRVGDFLNTNPLLGFLSERSNAFALVKERLTRVLKRRLVRANLEELDRADAARPDAGSDYPRELTVAILGRLHETTAQRGIPLVVQSIPTRRYEPLRLVEQFPHDRFPAERVGVRVFAAREVLEPWLDRELLYYTRSQDHWTPRAHALAGEALAELIDEAGWLRRPGAQAPGVSSRPSRTRNSWMAAAESR